MTSSGRLKMIWLQRFLMAMGALACVALGVIVCYMDFSKAQPHVLSEYPNAKWRGGADGGQFVEISKSEPPYYFVEIRNDDGSLWDQGWLKFGDENSQPLTADSVMFFAGEGVIYLQQSQILSADKAMAGVVYE
ncbi:MULTISPECIES: hypothetical protein [Pseudomonas]|uniref:Uncharacterized protein n=1 Tax=Pseudomonas wuhanensis TaxID=2954098 RepID=A0ABY9GSB4_9PSED|nr:MULTISPECIES: hypothetical protein [unclassified Pseudomonas]MDR8367753.1 hypothetical protein [Pseudomonas sp. JL3]WLI12729.1 hypothetical protein PSH65_00685 [Pseudomonas sp. FP603]WLI18605.1 hypothetical protein PSH88_00690 [Pseudomonas sp. FP607]